MPTAGGGEGQEPEVEKPDRAVHRDAEPEENDQEDDRRLHSPMRIAGSALPIRICSGPERRHQQLVEGALLAFARHRKRGEHQGLQHAERGDHRRHEVPARLEFGLNQARRTIVTGGGGAERRVVGCDDRADLGRAAPAVAELRPSRMICMRRLGPPTRRDSKSAGKLQRRAAPAPLSMLRRIWLELPSVATRSNTPVPSIRASSSRRGSAAAEVEDGIGRVGQVVGRPVAEEERLHEGRGEEQRSAGRILEQQPAAPCG